MALKLMFKGLWHNVWFANKIRWKKLMTPGLLQPLAIPSQLGGGFHGFHHRVTKV
jgi:hypothetical protein